MLQKISLESVFGYLKETPIYKIAIHSLIIVITVFFLSMIYLTVSHFDRFIDAIKWNSYSTEKLVTELEEDIKASLAINFELDKLIQESNANRATLFKFHNGKASLRGISFLYQSASHQQIKAGTSSTISNMQEIPLTVDPKGLQHLLSKECYFLDVATYNLTIKDIYEKLGTKTVVNCPIFNNKIIVGYLSLEYLYKIDIDNYEILKHYSNRVEKINDEIKIITD